VREGHDFGTKDPAGERRRPLVSRMSESTRLALAELESIKTWEDLVKICERQKLRRER